MLNRITRQRRVGAVTAVAALVAAVTVTGVSGASGAPSVRGFDGKTITVAGMGLASNFAGADIGAKARFKRANDTNEIKGVKLRYTEFADDNSDPAVATSQARRLVEQVGVFAIVPDLSPVNPGPYLNQQHVPYVGFAFDGTYCSSKPTTQLYGFGFSGCVLPSSPNVMPDSYAQEYQYVAKKTGKTHPSITIISNDTQSGKNSARFQATGAQGGGFKVVYAKGNVPMTTSDYSPYIAQWLTSDGGKQPDLIQCLLATQCLPIADALKAANYKGTLQTPLGIDIFAKQLAGTISTSFFNIAPSPGLTQMKADFTAAGAPATTPIFSEETYFAADIFIQALKTVVKQSGAKGITPEAVQKVLASQTWQINGLVGPIKYPASTVVSTPACGELITSSGTAPWTVVYPYACSSKQFKIDAKFTGS
jgi:ABC-type branched-subunit amino acid transport system substrate-binding protein